MCLSVFFIFNFQSVEFQFFLKLKNRQQNFYLSVCLWRLSFNLLLTLICLQLTHLRSDGPESGLHCLESHLDADGCRERERTGLVYKIKHGSNHKKNKQLTGGNWRLLKANLSDIVDKLLGNTCGSQLTGPHWYNFEHFIYLIPLFNVKKKKKIYIKYNRDNVKGLFGIKQHIRNLKRITPFFLFFLSTLQNFL